MNDNKSIFSLAPFNKTNAPISIFEQRVPVEVQMEYFSYSNKLRNEKVQISDEDCQSFGEQIRDEEKTLEQKRYMLSALAVSGKPQAFRILEEYTSLNLAPEIANWAYMAFMESRITLESELLEERHIYISTGLGGKDNKLRFFVLLLSKDRQPFLDFQKQIIQTEFEYNLTQKDCELERIDISDTYVELLVLIPLNIDIKDILDNIIIECNQYGNFISDTITITNVKELDQEEILKICQKA
ncbi:MAG: hypothetical protein LBH04_07270 [Tannerellaceae bacterium]|jgi:hypothetical protein|nr:hypothetical protein [Tannerellaceae bacterium]